VAEPGDQVMGLGGRAGRAQQIALHLGAAGAAHQLELVLGLDPFGGRLDAEAGAQAGYRLDDRDVLAAVAGAGDERAVDLDPVEREAAQVAQARIAGAEIVHRDAHAQRPQLVQRGPDHIVVLQLRHHHPAIPQSAASIPGRRPHTWKRVIRR